MSRAKANIEESAIKCIFFSEFHPTAGPKITFQVLLLTKYSFFQHLDFNSFRTIEVNMGYN